jgi:NADH-quinone oxidoreductase subunit C
VFGTVDHRELSSKYATLAGAIESRLGPRVTRLPTSTGELGYRVDAVKLLEICEALRDEEPFRFEMLMDLCAVDYLAYGHDEWQTEAATGTGFSRGVFREAELPADDSEREPVEYEPQARFAVVYHLLSISHNHRLRLKVFCSDESRPLIDSVTGIWASANWFEREAFDLYGVLFRGHPDLRRLLTDYGFIGHPFRKDFPLIGNVEVRYDPDKGRVVYEPVSIEPRTLVPKVIREDTRYEPDLRGGEDA